MPVARKRWERGHREKQKVGGVGFVVVGGWGGGRLSGEAPLLIVNSETQAYEIPYAEAILKRVDLAQRAD